MSIIKNEDGTYTVDLGIVVGVNSRNGLFYRREVIERELKRFNESPHRLISEMNHPKALPTDSWMVQQARLMDLHLERTCGILSDFTIREDDTPIIVGKFAPSGPFAQIAIDLIDSGIPVRFGLRAASFPRIHEGKKIKMLEKIVTWDLIG